MRRLSLRLRLALLGAIATIVALGLAAWALTGLFALHVERRAVAEMELQLEQVLAGLTLQPDNQLGISSPPTDPRFHRPYGGLYWQLAAADNVLRSRSLWDGSLDIPVSSVPQAEAQIHRIKGPDGAELLAVSRSVTLPPSLNGGMVTASVAMDSGEFVAARNAFAKDLAPYLALLTITLLGAQLAQLIFGLRPLRAIGQRIAALRAGETDRMGDEWPNEVQPLASEIDELLKMREADIERARFRAADLAHGLKTPLQALLGEAGRLRERDETASANSIEEIASAMQAHVERELVRSRVSIQAKNKSANVKKVVDQIVSVLHRTPRGAELEWVIDVPTGLQAVIDPADMAEALGALAENALHHARGEVRIDAVEHDRQIRLSVADDGPGVPDHQLKTIVERGKRLDETGTGTGIGLAIAHDIAAAVGGRIELANRPAGFVAVLVLPVLGTVAKLQ
ncbi:MULTISPECIES: HAMP domain-containing sensor histidine kinase [Phyllobacteriaceae]|uniref:histidine kinase n=1 Tax=Nitratireductor aestuarii TaxID=1735103 RepID=A0A916S5K9_9HYPH|nr:MULTISPECIES: HAMP domain-containing sensor histidine kinase [Phyllobacteriaceae]TWH25478.1 signal transduction histidine kinase [Aminobacter sp. J15]GGA82597.1 histidine kinase [Nitratireductor aestuarii]